VFSSYLALLSQGLSRIHLLQLWHQLDLRSVIGENQLCLLTVNDKLLALITTVVSTEGEMGGGGFGTVTAAILWLQLLILLTVTWISRSCVVVI